MSELIDVAVVSSRNLEDLNEDDRLLVAVLERRGLRAKAVAWRGEDVDWRRVGVAILRSTWDYSTRADEFLRWAEGVDKESKLLNPIDIVRWNINKRYLVELGERGCPVVPTRAFEQGACTKLDDILADAGWNEAVIKPVVSASGRDTYRVRSGETASNERFANLLARQDMIVQPFLERILDPGEVSLMFVGGRYTHAVLKKARPGEYRVQDDHGGTVHAYRPDDSLIRTARQIMENAGRTPVYARVDMAMDAAGTWRLMELELVEPELFLRFSPEATEALAEALHAALTGRGTSFPVTHR